MSIAEAVLIPVDCLHPRDWNPNRMSDAKFNALVQKIQDEKFTDPCKVVPCSQKEVEENKWETGGGSRKHYWLWAGEHRWQAAKVLDYEEVPCVVYDGEGWDEAAQKLKMVRDNIVSGEMDSRKFTELVKSLDPAMDIEPELFGFASDEEMQQYLIREKAKADDDFLSGLKKEAGKKQAAVDSIGDLVTNLFEQTAHTVDQNYLHFSWNGNLHTVVLMDTDTKKSLEGVLSHLSQTSENINDFMGKALKGQLARETQSAEKSPEQTSE